jgi:hypothetical protein
VGATIGIDPVKEYALNSVKFISKACDKFVLKASSSLYLNNSHEGL